MNNFIANDARIIYYKIVDNYSEKTIVRKKVEKITRYIHYYDDNGEFIKMKKIYGNYDDMQNISSFDAKQYFEK